MEEAKRNAAVYAADYVRQGMTLGLGSGTTVYWLIRELAQRVKQGLRLTIVPTSQQTALLAREAGIAVSDLNSIERLPLTIDGADEIGADGTLIKGGGGALLQEKIVASACDELVIIADSSKVVHRVGQVHLPVEVIPFGYKQVQQRLISSGFCKTARLRKKDDDIFLSDHSHYIIDCECGPIGDPAALNTAIHLIPGVVETGLFIHMASKAVIGFADGKIEVITFT